MSISIEVKEQIFYFFQDTTEKSEIKDHIIKNENRHF